MSFVSSRSRPHSDRRAGIEANASYDIGGQSGAATQPENKAEQASMLMRGLAVESAREIELLIHDLITLRDKLTNECSRVQDDVIGYTALSESVVQLTKVVAGSMARAEVERGCRLTNEQASPESSSSAEPGLVSPPT